MLCPKNHKADKGGYLEKHQDAVPKIDRACSQVDDPSKQDDEKEAARPARDRGEEGVQDASASGNIGNKKSIEEKKVEDPADVFSPLAKSLFYHRNKIDARFKP